MDGGVAGSLVKPVREKDRKRIGSVTMLASS